jgi:hypothetical protein
MNKTVVWPLLAQKNLRSITSFYEQRNQSSTYSNKLLKTFRDAANLIEKYPGASILTDFEKC